MLTDFMQMAHIMVGNVIPKAKVAEDRTTLGGGGDDEDDFEAMDGNYGTVHSTIGGGGENAAAGSTAGGGGGGSQATLKARNTGK